ncbi:citrate synthase/methylcitrate synthase [bacterium]|nr:citrate synthase/methylcitrate synthase [bacterium]MCP5461951.1 citrate synthase/methylcitrate synthase [bacterium]
MHENTQEITDIILKAAEKAKAETSGEPNPEVVKGTEWPINCSIGQGLEGAISCTTKIGSVNGSKGWLIYRGHNIFDLAAYTTFEEVSYALLHGKLPNRNELEVFNKKLVEYRYLPKTIRSMMSCPIERMNTMAAIKLGTNLMRQAITGADIDKLNIIACYHLISGLATVTAAVARIREGKMPIEPDPDLSHSANFLYMMTGKKPTPIEERIMDVSLILHADHGMNASTFAAMVVASTLSDMYFAICAGIAALNGPLHGGANEQVLHTLKEIGTVGNVKPWYDDARAEKRKIMGFGHRVYKAYDPRARILGPLAEYLVNKEGGDALKMYEIAKKLEHLVVSTLGEKKQIFPNVDFYSGLVYESMGIPVELFTPIFAVSRVSGWTARVYEYLRDNRIFRPRAMYLGEYDCKVLPIDER